MGIKGQVNTMIRCMIRCNSLQEEGWTIRDTDYIVVPRVGEGIQALIDKLSGNGVRTSTVTGLIVEKVTHFQATVNDHPVEGPHVLLQTRVEED